MTKTMKRIASGVLVSTLAVVAGFTFLALSSVQANAGVAVVAARPVIVAPRPVVVAPRPAPVTPPRVSAPAARSSVKSNQQNMAPIIASTAAVAAANSTHKKCDEKKAKCKK